MSSSETPAVLRLRDADREGVGTKARRLARLVRLEPSMFRVPDGVVVPAALDVPNQDGALEALLERHGLPGGPYAVRSCALDEDGPTQSQAGRYLTELNVNRDRLAGAIAAVRGSFGHHSGAVLVQPMIAAELAGVVFTRSPGNPALALCEFTSGTADRLVAGEVPPFAVEYGRWSGALYGEPGEWRSVLERVFLVSMIIEDAFGAPQDIEWAHDGRARTLYVLQARDITATHHDPAVADEQERLARVIVMSKHDRKRTVLRRSDVREVISHPTRLSRSLLERLYSPAGALGRALEMIGLPRPNSSDPYLISAFGQLYAHVDSEKRLFGFSLARWRAVQALRSRIRRDRPGLLDWLEREIDRIEKPPQGPPEPRKVSRDVPVAERAARLVDRVEEFTQKIYPVAYAATLLAQVTGERSASGSTTSRLYRDLSKLHHNRRIDEFVERWGHRSTNDYELSEPRFAEDAARALAHAARFASLPWDGADEERSFTHLKEVAKDRALTRLRPLREAALELDEAIGLDPNAVFSLALEDVEALAAGRIQAGDLPERLARRRREEKAWSAIDLGDDITLERVERLTPSEESRPTLKGRMVSVPVPFRGIARHLDSEQPDDAAEPSILIAPYLQPELVARFRAHAACIADVGGTLSHAAIVAREMRFPILVLPGSTSTIRDGDHVEVDAAGSIQLRPARADG